MLVILTFNFTSTESNLKKVCSFTYKIGFFLLGRMSILDGLTIGSKGNLESSSKLIFSASSFNIDQISLSQLLFGLEFPFGFHGSLLTFGNSSFKRTKAAEASNFRIFVISENLSLEKISYSSFSFNI